ncbi:MAG TPA: S41 family peptidase [Candidatus Babeliaceae bacterium]|nr:S41 family peptidase [Candidatus Babeliaceae bacterium]
MKKSFEENDAGFQYIIDQKGKEAYEIHNLDFQKRVEKISNGDSCVFAIRQWAKFFRVGHFGFRINQTPTTCGSSSSNNSAGLKNILPNISVQNDTYIKDYDSTTVYLRIPTFDSNHTREIDSVLHGNNAKITAKKNLIIDIRGNGGGTDQSFYEILPVIYTNPIRSLTVSYLSTANNNKHWEELASKKDIPESYRKYYIHYRDTMNANIGKFIRLRDSVYMTTYSTKFPNPQNVAIIIDGDNGSTAEEFLMKARQSKKVKLFGTTTMGELDISNMYHITSPDKKYTLSYCTSKSLRIPENTIDNKGIEPDFFIDKTIPGEKWLRYVAGIIESW